VVLVAANDREAPAAALALGAADVMAAPVHLPELCARLHARIRERQDTASGGEPGATPAELPDQELELEALDCRVRQEFERARRYSLSFSLVLLGIDELRGIEEHRGAEAAELLRREVASVLRRELRLPDFVVSYRSGEFAIVLPETGQAGARQSVLRVRERLAVVPSEADPRLDRPRFSAGIVTYPHPAVSQTDELLALAEAALMRGRSQAGERIGMAI
jgi:diguanylate cyclase (GGDEF)-like protein